MSTTPAPADDAGLIADLVRLYPPVWRPLLVGLCPRIRAHEHLGEPCTSPGKIAIERDYNRRALERFERGDPVDLAALVHHLEDGNLGNVLPPPIYVLDADDLESAERLEKLLDGFPYQRTPRGAHVFVRAPAGVRLRGGSKIRLLSNGDTLVVDVKTPTQHVVTCPSSNPEGRLYTFVRPLPPRIDDVPEAPGWLLEALSAEAKPSSRATPSRPPEGADGIPQGARNNALTSLAGSMRRRGMCPEAIEAALLEENRRRCRPPLAEGEVRKTALSVSRYDPAQSESTTLAASAPSWPDPLGDAAFHGLLGELVRAIAPHTEADPAALLGDLLAQVGNAIGRTPYFMAEGASHHTNLFVAMVGETAKGRKGSAHAMIRRPLASIDEDWARECQASGLSSAEGLIWAVRDPIAKQEAIREKRRVVGYQEVVVDPGITDKRMLIFESEFASTLRVMAREGNTLSAVLRQAWDSGDLRSLTKNSPARATDAHVSVIAHIVRDELLRYLDRSEVAGGLANRFLWLCVRRSQVLPEGGRLDEGDLVPILRSLREAVRVARGVGEVPRDDDARDLWHQVYPDLSEGRPGMLGAVTSRAEAQVMRVATLYALADRSRLIGRVHLEAGLEVWRYAFESAQYVFGESLGDPDADTLLRALRRAPKGLTRTEVSAAFGRHRGTRQIERALAQLVEHGLAHCEPEETAGRPVERWRAGSIGRS